MMLRFTLFHVPHVLVQNILLKSTHIQLYLLKIVLYCETNCEFAPVKVILYDNAQVYMTLNEVKRLSILISRVEQLCESEVGPTLTSHLKFSRPCLDIILASIHLEELFIGMSLFHHETIDLFQLMLHDSDILWDIIFLEIHSPLKC